MLSQREAAFYTGDYSNSWNQEKANLKQVSLDISVKWISS